MRLVSSVFALAVLGCCFGPSVEAPPPPAPEAPSPLSQALSGMGVAPSEGTPGAAAGAAPAGGAPAGGTPSAALSSPPAASFGAPAAAPAPAASPASAASAAPSATAAATTPACAEAQAAREAVRAELRDLRMTVGADSAARLDAAGAAMIACDRDVACLKDPKARLARIDAYDRAKAAQEADATRLAQAELGSYEADQRVVAACGAP